MPTTTPDKKGLTLPKKKGKEILALLDEVKRILRKDLVTLNGIEFSDCLTINIKFNQGRVMSTKYNVIDKF